MEAIYITDTDFINRLYEEEETHSVVYGILFYQDKTKFYINVLSLLKKQRAYLIAKTKLKLWIEELNLVLQALKEWKEKADKIIVVIPFVEYRESIEVTIDYFKYAYELLKELQSYNWNDDCTFASECVPSVPSLEEMLFTLVEDLEAGSYSDDGSLYINGEFFYPATFKEIEGEKIPIEWEGYGTIVVDEMIRRGIEGQYRKSSRYNENLYRSFFISETPIVIHNNTEKEEGLGLMKNAVKIGVFYYMLKNIILDTKLLTKVISFACNIKYDKEQKISNNTAYSYIQKKYFLNKRDGIDEIKKLLLMYDIPIPEELH